MKILAIETSCDETAVSIISAEGTTVRATFAVLGDALLSQMEKHQPYGGVYPNLAKREHQNNIVPMLEKALTEAILLKPGSTSVTLETLSTLQGDDLRAALRAFIETHEIPDIDAVAVTYGPGLEPALWVGITVAETLAKAWHKQLVPINHMEGHVLSSLIKNGVIEQTAFPVLALLISGGHTELVLMRDWLTYTLIGQTLDDAVGEAFDKVARMLGLPYPGGPQISKLAEQSRTKGAVPTIKLPRPMLHTTTCDFSFSGLKTAVLYTLRNFPELTDDIREEIAHEFEDAVTDVLVKKTERALEATGAKTLVVGGGVSANKEIRRRLQAELGERAAVAIPDHHLTTDNAVMIGVAAFYRILLGRVPETDGLKAYGTLPLSSD